MYRFFVSNKLDNNKFELDKDILNHIKVLRLKKDEKIYCIYEKEIYLCHVENNYAIIEEKTNINNEFKYDVYLFASIINIKRFEWLIQKSVELGVTHFVPMITKNVNKKYLDQFKSKITRFNEISKNASEQSFRNILIKIAEPITFEQAIKIKTKHKYIAHEKVDQTKNNDQNIIFESNISFFVGPEGGFDDKEIEQAINNDIIPISLGKRILRAETASLYLLSRITK